VSETLGKRIAERERQIVIEALTFRAGSLEASSRDLGVSAGRLWRMVQRHGLAAWVVGCRRRAKTTGKEGHDD
jgi:transcriptional regulator of acetoin/glycerol metabolism